MSQQPPTHSIENYGGLEAYVNRFFKNRNLPYTYQGDVVPMFNKTGLPVATRARQLGIVKSTFENWERIYRATEEI